MHCAEGLDNWFGLKTPPRWKQAVMIWLVFFPVSLCFSLLLGDTLASLPVLLRAVHPCCYTPVMVFLFIPLSSRLLHNWLQRGLPTPASCTANPESGSAAFNAVQIKTWRNFYLMNGRHGRYPRL
jgi:antibiotic biosynthesis monooxygenase (ABM) superfamily enzyme